MKVCLPLTISSSSCHISSKFDVENERDQKENQRFKQYWIEIHRLPRYDVGQESGIVPSASQFSAPNFLTPHNRIIHHFLEFYHSQEIPVSG